MSHLSRARWLLMVLAAVLLLATPLVALAAQSITWTTKAPMPTGRAGIAVAALGDHIYVVGGYTETGAATASVERYTPATDSWTSVQELEGTIAYTGAIGASDGHLYIFGGEASDGYASVVVYYDPSGDDWDPAEPMPTERAYVAVAEVNGKIYAIGGYDGDDFLGTNEVFDLSDGTWSTAAALPVARAAHGAVAVGTKVYVVGGFSWDEGVSDRLDIYDTTTNSWSQGASMPVAAEFSGIAAVNNRIYVIGGYDENQHIIFNNVQEYDVASDTWSQANPISRTRSELGAAVVGGKIYAIGGGDELMGPSSIAGATWGPAGQVSAGGVRAQALTGLNEEGTLGQAPTPPPEVPEPGSMLLLASGLAGLGGFGAVRARLKGNKR